MTHHRDHERKHDDRQQDEDLDRHPADVARADVREEMEARGESLDDWSPDDDRRYREDHERSADRLADVPYDRVRPAYQLGHRAAGRSQWRGRPFEEIETELQKGWTDEHRRQHGDWDRMRPYAASAFRARMSRLGSETSATGSLSTLPTDRT
jgi:hypothetical protein